MSANDDIQVDIVEGVTGVTFMHAELSAMAANVTIVAVPGAVMIGGTSVRRSEVAGLVALLGIAETIAGTGVWHADERGRSDG